MCGILTLVRVGGPAVASTAPAVTATHAVRHRGPDDEGYLLWDAGDVGRPYAGPHTTAGSRAAHELPWLPDRAPWRVAMGHRRLSIVDLSPAGHQPMVDAATGLSLVYNGEIYNHVELRRELEGRGRRFVSHCDTEVVLHAWAEWGPACLDRFNGMFSFVLLDPRGGGTLHAVRDRFGVKPMYFGRVGDLLAFASEIKQIRSLPGFAAKLDLGTVRDYLATGLMDFSRHTFDAGISQLLGGERATVRLDDATGRVDVTRWYDLRARPFDGSFADAAAGFRELLTDSVRLRLRADVPVGSCLSGGLDSSAIVCLARRALEAGGEHRGQMTVTARFKDARFDEWQFAREVISATGAGSVEVWPSVERLERDLDLQLWHMDEPFGSTSMFSQWCVFGAAADAGLKVMLDGQGSDEQLAGYSGNDGALMTGLLRRGALTHAAREFAAQYRVQGNLKTPVARLVLAMRDAAPWIDPLFPRRLRRADGSPEWLRLEAPTRLERPPVRELNEALRQQTLLTSLPVLLRYEDRNSMARSIEARVPFLDVRLVEFVAGLPDHFKLRSGVTKAVMRDAMGGVLPEAVRGRRDKMGFVTPEEVWVTRTARDWFHDGVMRAVELAPEFFHADRVKRMVEDIADGRRPFSNEPWRILCLGRWMETAFTGRVPDEGAASVAGPPVAAGAELG